MIDCLIEYKLDTRTTHPLVKANRLSTYLSKSKFNLKSDHVNLVAPASPIKCLLYLPNVLTTQYKLRPERLTRLGNSNVLRLPSRQTLGSQDGLVQVNRYAVWLHFRKSVYCFAGHVKIGPIWYPCFCLFRLLI